MVVCRSPCRQVATFLLPSYPTDNEMSYNPRPAARISFFCVQPADDGGESLLARNADLAALLPPDYERRFAERGGIKYVREYGDATAIAQLPKPEPGKMPRWFQSWQERTGTDDRVEAERFWREEMGFEDVRWDEEGTMHLAWHTSAFLRDPATGESLWFNSVVGNSHAHTHMQGEGRIKEEKSPVHLCSAGYLGSWPAMNWEILLPLQRQVNSIALGGKCG